MNSQFPLLTLFSFFAVAVPLVVALFAVYEWGRKAAFKEEQKRQVKERLDQDEKLRKEREKVLDDTKAIIEEARRKMQTEDSVSVANKLVGE